MFVKIASLNLSLLLFCILKLYGQEPLIGCINYDALKGGVKGQADVSSLSPPKFQHLLPFYAKVYNDSSRLVRTRSTEEEIVYCIPDSDIVGFKVETAYHPNAISQPDNELQFYTSTDNNHYDLLLPGINDIGQDWRKVDYWAYSPGGWSGRIPKGTRYLKIRFNRVDGMSDSPQIMRLEINYGEQGRKRFIDELNDFSKAFSHTGNLSFATGQVEKFNVVTANSYCQEIMDQELEYARYAGIDYMAYLDCPDGDPINWGADLLLKSKIEMNFCFIVHLRDKKLESWEQRVKRYVKYFKEKRYQKVLDGRPLIYLFNSGLFSDADLDLLREAAKNAGLRTPYIVTANTGRIIDAKSGYGTAKPGFDVDYWDSLKKAGNKVVLHISLGANAECRHENPPPWGSVSWKEPFPAASEMLEFVKKGIHWVKSNQETAEANTILLYSWNEFAEGGAMCPKIGGDRRIIDTFSQCFGK